jgi:MYXO-CTERM domain-containing protein
MKTFALTAATAAALAFTLGARDAAAFCRTWSCDPTRETCPPDPENAKECPIGGVPGVHHPLYWPVKCVGFSLQENASRQVPYPVFEKLAQQAFATWQNVKCEGGDFPSLFYADLGSVACGVHEYNADQGNANILLFHDDFWPYQNVHNTLALTTLTFNTETGEIYDADMEINGANTKLTTGNADVKDDLLSILTHEAGHFIGLAHSPNQEATMFASYSPGTTSLRDLHPDDVNGVCAIYPSVRSGLPACDPTPRHGYSKDCATDTGGETSNKVLGMDCALSTGGSSPGGALLGLAVLAGAALVRRRRHERS